MALNNVKWEHWRSFLAVFKTGHLSGAARTLSLTQPTLGRHIDTLENAIGAKLFTRSQAGLAPTSRALTLVPYARDMASAALALGRIASGDEDQARGTVRLTASEIIGVEVLPPMLADFRVKHPRIAIELDLTNQQGDLLRHDADIAIRMTAPTQLRLVRKKAHTASIGLFAHRSYTKSHGAPKHIDQIFEHDLIGVDQASERLEGINLAGKELTADDFSYRCDSDLGQLAALRAGLGIGLCQKSIATRDADLVPVLPDEFAYSLEMWVVMHEDLGNNRRVRLLFDHLSDALGSVDRGDSQIG